MGPKGPQGDPLDTRFHRAHAIDGTLRLRRSRCLCTRHSFLLPQATSWSVLSWNSAEPLLGAQLATAQRVPATPELPDVAPEDGVGSQDTGRLVMPIAVELAKLGEPTLRLGDAIRLPLPAISAECPPS